MSITTPEPSETPNLHPKPRRRSRGWIAAAAVVSILAVGTMGWAFWSSNQPTTAPSAPIAQSTVPVTAGNMIAQTNVNGTLQYAFTLPITATITGTVTELPATGATIAPGGVLYRVDTRPVFLLRGQTPAWRDFSTEMTNGDDVRQLETNLKSLGFFSAEPDTRFTWDTAAAVMAWQKSVGVEATGMISKTTIVFTDQDLRVNEVTSRTGAVVGDGAALFTATGLQQVVNVDMKSTDRQLAVPGTEVTIALPTGTETPGTVASVGAPAAKANSNGNGTSIIVPVTITLATQDGVSGLALSTVTARFASPLRENVLTVPIDALVPLDDTRFAVETPTADPDQPRTLIPVTVGAFASGNVEISGEGITAGLEVVVPQR